MIESFFKAFIKVGLAFAVFGIVMSGYHVYTDREFNKTAEGQHVKNIKEVLSPEDIYNRAYSTTLAIEGATGHFQNGGSYYLSNDETGKQIHLWSRHVKFMEDNWGQLDKFGGVEGGEMFDRWVEEFKRHDIPMDVKKYHPEFISLERMITASNREGKVLFPELNGCRNQGWKDRSYLHWVARFGCIECVKKMVEEHNADVNWADCSGMTPAMLAAERGHFEVVWYLVPLMSEKAKNAQRMFNGYKDTLYDSASEFDFSSWNGGHPKNSGVELKHFLSINGVVSTPQIVSQRTCFSRYDEDADIYRNQIVAKQGFDADIRYGESKKRIDDCLFLKVQYEHNCNTYNMDCDKQKQLLKYIRTKGFDMSNFSQIKYLFHVQKANGSGWIDKQGGLRFREIMEQRNGKKCNFNFSDCNQKLVWERSSLGVVHRGN